MNERISPDLGEPVTVSGLNWARKHKRAFSGVLTLEDPDAADRLRFHRKPNPSPLVLRFVDLDSPPLAAYAGMPVFRMADHRDIGRGLEFGREVAHEGGERGRPENRGRRAYNRTAHFVFYGLALGPDE